MLNLFFHVAKSLNLVDTLFNMKKTLFHTSGLELARVPRVPGTRRNSEHHLWHPLILSFLILTGTLQSSFYLISGTLSFKFLTQALLTYQIYPYQHWKPTRLSNLLKKIHPTPSLEASPLIKFSSFFLTFPFLSRFNW